MAVVLIGKRPELFRALTATGTALRIDLRPEWLDLPSDDFINACIPGQRRRVLCIFFEMRLDMDDQRREEALS
jgi:hypothetical protein